MSGQTMAVRIHAPGGPEAAQPEGDSGSKDDNDDVIDAEYEDIDPSGTGSDAATQDFKTNDWATAGSGVAIHRSPPTARGYNCLRCR